MIANTFYVCGKIEKLGRGTLDMIEDCEKAGNPIPVYQDLGACFSVTLPLKVSIRTIEEHVHQRQILDFDKLTNRQRKILDVLKDGSLNRHQIMEKTLLTNRTTQRELTSLKNMGFVQSQGKTSAMLWRINFE